MPDPQNRAQGTGNIVLLSLLLLLPALILARSQDQTKCSDKVYKPITALVRGSNTSPVSLRPLLAAVKISFPCLLNPLSLCRDLLQRWQRVLLQKFPS